MRAGQMGGTNPAFLYSPTHSSSKSCIFLTQAQTQPLIKANVQGNGVVPSISRPTAAIKTRCSKIKVITPAWRNDVVFTVKPYVKNVFMSG